MAFDETDCNAHLALSWVSWSYPCNPSSTELRGNVQIAWQSVTDPGVTTDEKTLRCLIHSDSRSTPVFIPRRHMLSDPNSSPQTKLIGMHRVSHSFWELVTQWSSESVCLGIWGACRGIAYCRRPLTLINPTLLKVVNVMFQKRRAGDRMECDSGHPVSSR